MTEDELNSRLDAIYDRLKWISDAEYRAALVGGWAAKGWFDPEREELIKRAEKALDDLVNIGGSPRFHPKDK